jgi:hypothetical protein
MISHVSNASRPAYTAPHPTQAPKAKPVPQKKEDTVELSNVAKTYGNVENPPASTPKP